MAIINMLPHPSGGGSVTLLKQTGGRSRTETYTFTEDFKTVLITIGCYASASISTSGWTSLGSAGGSTTGMGYAWKKENVTANETVTIEVGDRGGLNIIGIN